MANAKMSTLINPCGLALDMQGTSTRLPLHARIHANEDIFSELFESCCSALPNKFTGRLLIADHGNNAVVRVEFGPLVPPEFQACHSLHTKS
jgi:hypothetical protein